MDNTNTKFSVGDVVRLKSGGPAMTVCGFHPEESSHHLCVWFADGERRQGAFTPVALEPATADHGGLTSSAL